VTLAANSHKRYAIGLRHEIRRSTLADANESRDWHIWSDLAALLIRRARKLYSECDLGLDLSNTVYALDSTTIDLCLSLFEWASFRSTKAAVKMHTLLDLRGNIPTFIHVSDGKMGDVNVLDLMPLEAGAFYVMDRGYLDYSRLYKMHQSGAFFVTRAKRGMDARRVYSAPSDRKSGVICDQSIALNGFYASKGYPEHLRRVRFNDQELDKTLVFLTNNTALPPLTIAALYKSRWQVELFFKWIKQHLRIKKFLGTTENAVKTQIWCAVSTYVLIAIIKKEPKLEASLYNILQILSISVFEKSLMSQAFQPELDNEDLHGERKQLILFDF
jgi:Transposase DDE domain